MEELVQSPSSLCLSQESKFMEDEFDSIRIKEELVLSIRTCVLGTPS